MVKCCRCLGLSLKLLPCNCDILSGDYYIHMTNIIFGIWKITNFPSSSNIGLLWKLEVSMKCQVMPGQDRSGQVRSGKDRSGKIGKDRKEKVRSG